MLNAGTELGSQPLQNAPITFGNITVEEEFIEQVFEIKHDERFSTFIVVVGTAVLFRALALLCLRSIKHEEN